MCFFLKQGCLFAAPDGALKGAEEFEKETS